MKDQAAGTQIIRSLNRQLRMSLNTLMGMANFLQETELDSKQAQYVASIRDATDKMLEHLDQTLKVEHLLLNHINMDLVNLHLEDFLKDFTARGAGNGVLLKYEIHPNTPKWILFDKEALLDMLTGISSFLQRRVSSGTISIVVRKTQEVGDRFFLKLSMIAKSYGAMLPGSSDSTPDLSDHSSVANDFQLMIALKLMEHLKIKPRAKYNAEKELEVEFFIICEETIKEEQKNPASNVNIKSLKFNAHILVVEDVQLNQIVTRLMLENYGCTVDIAENGQVALEMFRPGKYDCIIMDIEMPVMDGIEATQAIKRSHSNVPPIIGLSANALQKDAKWGVSEGLDDYITKPVKKETLALRLYHWIPNCAVNSNGRMLEGE